MKKYLLLCVSALVLSAGITSCKDEEKKEDKVEVTPDPTLYERVGGSSLVNDPATSGEMIEQGYLTLRSVVDSSILVIAGDADMQPFFEVLLTEVGAGNTTGFAALSKNLTDFFAFATGSENHTYAGIDMEAAHDPSRNGRMGKLANNDDFTRFIGDVAVGLAQNGVTDQELINDLVALIETLRTTVVQA